MDWECVEYWDKIARHYDFFSAMLNENLEEISDRIASIVPIGARVLELGCGTGAVTASIAARSSKVIALDTSSKMLAHTEKRLEGIEIKNVTTIQRDANTLKGLGTFDVVIISNLLHLIGDPINFLLQCKLALSKNGFIIAQTSLHGENFRSRFSSWAVFLRESLKYAKLDQKACGELFLSAGLELDQFYFFKGNVPIGLVVTKAPRPEKKP